VVRGEEKGKLAGEDPYPKAELRRQLLDGGKWRSGGASGGRGVAAASCATRVCGVRRRLRVLRNRGRGAGAL
jgi:hypothetical protein